MTEQEVEAIKARIWNGWGMTRSREHDGNPSYIIHMWQEQPPKRNREETRSFCGVRIAESGLLNLNEVEPGCMKCRKILRKRGLLSEKGSNSR